MEKIVYGFKSHRPHQPQFLIFSNMKKFIKLINSNGNEVLNRRAESIASDAEIAQQNLVNTYKQMINQLTRKIADLTDLAPDTVDSLRPGGKDWSAQRWATELQNAKQELYTAQISLRLAEETYNEYFTDTDE